MRSSRRKFIRCVTSVTKKQGSETNPVNAFAVCHTSTGYKGTSHNIGIRQYEKKHGIKFKSSFPKGEKNTRINKHAKYILEEDHAFTTGFNSKKEMNRRIKLLKREGRPYKILK